MIKFKKTKNVIQAEYKKYKLQKNLFFFNSKSNFIYRSKSKLVKKTESTFLEAYILDEGFYKFIMIKPYVSIYNIGNSLLKNFKMHYYFIKENIFIFDNDHKLIYGNLP